MLDVLASIVANGSTWGPLTYEPWLPFYEFFPIMIAGSIVAALVLWWLGYNSMTRSILGGAMVLTSGFAAVPVVYVLWLKLDLSPLDVFGWWGLNFILILISQIYLVLKSARVRSRIEEMEKTENADCARS